MGDRFRHRRAGSGSLTSPAPIRHGFFNQPGLGIMLREAFGLGVHQFGEIGFERLCDLRVQLLPSLAQQIVVRRILYQRVLEAVDRVGRHTTLQHQLGGDKPSEGGLQLVLGQTGDGAQQRVGKFASDRGADLRHMPRRCQAVEPRQQRGMQCRRDRR